MPSESLQHKLDRVRRPRVQITYDVETNGAMQRVELPFVVGVIADLSGQPAEPLPPLKERKFVAVDRDNVDEVLRRSKPRLALDVPNRLGNDGTKLPVALTFESMEDFEPANVARRVDALAGLLKARHALSQILGKLEGNDQFEAELAEVLGDPAKAKQVADALGVKPRSLPAAPAATASPAPGAPSAGAAAPAAPEPATSQPQASQAESKPADSAKPEEKK